MAGSWEEIARSESCALVTDLDGSLVPFADDPAHARPSSHVVQLLTELSQLDRTMVVVASGRPKSDLELYFGCCEKIELFAEHGLWVRDRGTWRMTDDIAPEPLTDLAIELDVVASAFPGAHVERKTRGVGVHYRRVADERKLELIEKVQARIDRTIAVHRYLERLQGHEVIEVRLHGVTKAKAVHLVRKQLGPHAPIIALGDDITDEDMFRQLSPNDAGIMIGPAEWETAATSTLADPDQAIALVGRLLELRRAALAGR